MKKTLLALALFISTSAWSATSLEQLPKPEVETLPNGLMLVWFPNDHLPVVDIALMLKSGFRDDPQGKSGTFQLLENSLDRGNAGMSAQELARAVEMLGASRYASTDEDTFSVGVHGLAPDAPALLELLGKFALKPEFPAAEVKREHARILENWKHIGDSAQSLVSVTSYRALYAGSVYGRAGMVSAKEFATIGREDVLDFYKKHFTPKNAILMVVGRVNKAEFREKIVASFGAWQGEEPKRTWKKYTDPRFKPKKAQILVVDRPELTQAQVQLGFRAPLVNDVDHYPLVVGNALIGEYFDSRLNSVIRDKLGLTYGIGSSFSCARSYAVYTVGSSTRNESVGQLIRKTLDILGDVKKGQISDDEVRMSKEYLTGGYPLSVATLGAVASRWLSGYVFDRGSDYLNEFVPKVNAATRAEVVAAVAKHFDLENIVVVVAGDAKAITQSLKASQLTQIKQVSVKDLF